MGSYCVKSGSKKRESMEEFVERVRCMAVRAFPSLGRAGIELYSVEFFLKGLGNKRTSLAVLDKAPDSIGKAVDWANNFEANVSWVGEDSKARVVEEMTHEGQVYRFEGGNKGGHLKLQCRRGPMCFGCRELGHTAVSCPKLRHLND